MVFSRFSILTIALALSAIVSRIRHSNSHVVYYEKTLILYTETAPETAIKVTVLSLNILYMNPTQPNNVIRDEAM